MKIALAIVLVVLLVFLSMKKLESLKNKSTEELREMLAANANPTFFKNAGLELKKRGEDISSYLGQFVSMLESDDRRTRFIGFLTIKALFPDVVPNRKLVPGSPSEDYRAFAHSIRESSSIV